ncbi:MAG: ImmA/IrrE family metallo-endopeptidase [Lachnospiraceae bacterium]|nr:ImmA/IrrE family metallo-endopeptidase [Lachnospiraceae bacterium]
MTAAEVLGGDVLPDAPVCHSIPFFEDPEKNAAVLRKHLGFAKDGQIEDLIGKPENKGILVYECGIDNDKFSGMNGIVNGRPFIVVNPSLTPEQNRSAVVHELAHLMFVWPENLGDREIESMAAAIGGAFLFPESDARRELGIHRSSIAKDMILTAREYGISMMMLAKRAETLRIITTSAAKDFCIRASKAGWRTDEPSRINRETPVLFEQLVYRAVNEEEISVQRGAELLRVPYDKVFAIQDFDWISPAAGHP